MESLAIALMLVIVLLLGGGALLVGLVCMTALLHAVRAPRSRRSARAARWVGLAGMVIGLVVAAVTLTRTGSVGLGAVNFNVLAGLGAILVFAVGCFAFVRAWAGPESTPDEVADRAATLAVYPRAVSSAVVFAFAVTVIVCIVGYLTKP